MHPQTAITLAAQAARADRTLWGECLAGALYLEDFRRLAAAAGFANPRVLQTGPIAVRDAAMAAAVGGACFASVTFRLFKLAPGQLEDAPEDYGQVILTEITHILHPLVAVD